MAVQFKIQFPDVYSLNPTVGEKVVVTRKDTDGNVLSSNEILLVANAADGTSDIDFTSMISGEYDIVFDNQANFAGLDITGFTHENAGQIDSADPLIDILKFSRLEDASDLDIFFHNIGYTNYMVSLVSLDALTLKERMITSTGSDLKVKIYSDRVEVINAATNGYTNYEVKIFARGNLLEDS